MKKHKFIKKLIAAVGILAVGAVTLTACSNNSSSSSSSNNPSSVAAIKKRGTLKVDVFGDLPPNGWVNNDDKRVGHDVRLARELAKEMGVKVKFVQVNANNRVDTLNANKADIVLANFTVTSERKQVVDFAKPYMKVSVGVVSPKSKPITNVNQLKGKKGDRN